MTLTIVFTSNGFTSYAVDLSIETTEEQLNTTTADDLTDDSSDVISELDQEVDASDDTNDEVEDNNSDTTHNEEDSSEQVTDDVDNVDEEVVEEPESNTDDSSEGTEEEVEESEEVDETEEQIVSYKDLDVITTEYKLALDSLEELFPKYITANTNKENEVSIRIYDWTPIDDYDQYLGSYNFEPVIDTDYVIADDVTAPILTVEVLDESAGTMGLIEIKEDYEVPSVSSSNLLRSSSSSATYNGYESGYLPEIRDQGSEGACWAFSAMGAIETDLIKSGAATSNIDLSELQLAYFTAHDYTDPKGCRDDSYTYTGDNYLSNGGNSHVASAALMNKVGAVPEAHVPYSKGSTYVPSEEYAVNSDYAEVTDVYEININDKDLIKQAILDHGSVSAAFFASEGNFTITSSNGSKRDAQVHYSATYNSFYGQIDSTNHAITLVGWDDNFPASNFYDGCKPEGDGAWLVRNSWGLDDYGRNGYFWLSYYDAGLLDSGSVTAYSATTDMYDNVYSYTSSVGTAYFSFKAAGAPVSYNVDYTVDANETISAVAVQTMNTNATIGVSVTDGVNTAAGQYSNTCVGTYTIPLDSPFTVDATKDVTITVTITPNSSEKAYVVYEQSKTTNIGEIAMTVKTDRGFTVQGLSSQTDGDAKVKLFTNNSTGESTVGKLEVTNGPIYDYVGTTHQLELSADSVVTNVSDVTWTVINEDIATVDANGLVTMGSTKGTTVVKGTYSDGTNTYTVNFNVTVRPYTIEYILGDDVSYRKLYKTYYPGNSGYCVLPSSSDMARNGYRLVGWTTVEGDENYKVTSTSLLTTHENLVLYPIWTKYAISLYYYVPQTISNDSITYTNSIKYIGQTTIANVPYNITCTSSYNNPSQYATEGFEFDYWSTDAAGENPIATINEDSFVTTRNATYGTYSYVSTMYLYPQYKKSNKYKVTLDANGGNVSSATVNVLYGGTYDNISTPTRTGYDFIGWHINTIDGDIVTNETEVTIEADHTLVAEWKAKSITVTFDANGGSVTESDKIVTYGQAYGELPVPTRKGYSFGGWYYSNTTNIYTEDTVVSATSNHTLVALWEVENYLLTIDSNGGTCSTASKTVVYGEEYGTLPTPNRTGYSFEGWHIENTDGSLITKDSIVETDSDHTIVAVWEAISCVVSFDAGQGTVDVESKNVTYDDAYGTLPTANREGYSFDGWFDLDGEKYTSSTIVSTTDNHVLYASWTPEVYSITYDANGGVCSASSKEVTYDEVYGELPVPTRAHYIFEGWHLGDSSGDKVYDSSIVTTNSNHTLVANWIQDGYTITFNATDGKFGVDDNGNDIKTAETILKYSDTYGKYGDFPIPSCDGKYLVGWYTVNYSAEVSESAELITETSVFTAETEQTLYARWATRGTVDAPQIKLANTYGENSDTVGINSKLYASCNTNGATIYYTTNSDISTGYTTDWNIYNDGISLDVTGDVTYYFVAIKDNWNDSQVVNVSYTVVDNTGDENLIQNASDRAEYLALNKPNGIWIAGITSYDYTGTAIKLSPDNEGTNNYGFRVYDGVTLLTYKTDYTYALKNNTKVGTATLTINGKGNYSGSYLKSFTINQMDIASDEITTDDINVVYTGKNQKPSTVLTRIVNGKKITLKNGKDYSATWATTAGGSEMSTTAVKEPGSYIVTITGKDKGYTGTRTINYTILDNGVQMMSKAAVKLEYSSVEYDGSAKEPGVTTVKVGKNLLAEGTDYTVSYHNNVSVGTASVTITAVDGSNYYGSKTVSFKITGVALSKAKFPSIPAKVYDGVEYKPFAETYEEDEANSDDYLHLTYQKNKKSDVVNLKVGTDYTVSYSNNIKAGKATVVFTGMGKFTGTVKKTYKIQAYNIKEDANSKIDIGWPNDVNSFEYTKGGVKPAVSVSFDGTLLTEGTDYTLKYSNNTAVNDGSNVKKIPTVTVTGKGNFAKTSDVKLTFVIESTDIDDVTITAPDKVVSNKPNAYKVSPVLTQDGKKLKAGVDYQKLSTEDYTYADKTFVSQKNGEGLWRIAGDQVQETDIIPVGTVININVTGINSYAGTSTSVKYKIIAGDMSKAKITLKSTGVLKTGTDYTGMAQLIDKDSSFEKVVISGNTLSSDDYEIIDYKNNLKKGTATITLKGIGNYGGTKNYTFKIKAKSISYKIQYVANSQTIDGVEVTPTGTMPVKLSNNGDFTLLQPSYKVNGKLYVFEGWYYEPDFANRVGEKGTKINVANMIDPSETLKLYARFEPVGKYTINYNPNAPEGATVAGNTSGKTNSQSAKRGTFTRLAKNGYSIKDYKFNGWNTEPDGSGVSYNNNVAVYNLTSMNGEITLYAQWEAK